MISHSQLEDDQLEEKVSAAVVSEQPEAFQYFIDYIYDLLKFIGNCDTVVQLLKESGMDHDILSLFYVDKAGKNLSLAKIAMQHAQLAGEKMTGVGTSSGAFQDKALLLFLKDMRYFLAYLDQGKVQKDAHAVIYAGVFLISVAIDYLEFRLKKSQETPQRWYGFTVNGVLFFGSVTIDAILTASSYCAEYGSFCMENGPARSYLLRAAAAGISVSIAKEGYKLVSSLFRNAPCAKNDATYQIMDSAVSESGEVISSEAELEALSPKPHFI